MTRGRLWFWRLAPVGVWCLCVGVYFVWGACEGARYDERVAALRAEGRLGTSADAVAAPLPGAENGYAVLDEAARLLRTIQREWRTVIEGEGQDFFLIDSWDPDEDDDVPEARAYAERKLERLAPYFALLQKAAGHAGFQAPATGPGAPAEAEVRVLLACQQLWRAGRLHPEQVPANMDLMLALVRRCSSPDPTALVFRAIVWRAFVAAGMRRALGPGLDAARAGRWTEQLEAAEARLLAGLGVAEQERCARVLEVVEAWRDGRDPLAPHRPAPSDADEEAASASPITVLLQGLEPPAPGWRARWYGRPWLQHEIHTVLDDLERGYYGPWDLERLRAAVTRAPDEQNRWKAHSAVLQALVAMRLMRIALTPGPWRDAALTTTQRQEALEAALASSLPRDPFSGEPYVAKVEPDAFVITCAPSELQSQFDAAFILERGMHVDYEMRVRIPLR